MIRQKKYSTKAKSRSSRGYCGYFNGNYLRSLNEYIVAFYLEYLKTKYPYLTYGVEDKIYQIDSISYKPDFFIYQNNNLWGIIEVKDPSAKKTAKDYSRKFSKFFGNRGIRYVVIYKERFFNKMQRKACMTEDIINEWKENSTYNPIGENNPRWGSKTNDVTKRKIGDKTKERFEDNTFREKHRQSMIKAMNDPERIKNLSLKAKERQKKINPKHTVVCPECGITKIITNSEYNRLWKNNPIKGCSSACTKKLNQKNGTIYRKGVDYDHKSIKKRFQNEIKKIGLKGGKISNNQIAKAKEKGIIYLHSPLSEKSLLKYFRTLSIQEVLNESL